LQSLEDYSQVRRAREYGGIRSQIAGSKDLTFNPFFAETCMMSFESRPNVSSICSAIRSGSAFGRSILFNTGMTGRFFSSARKKFATYGIS
jgi:hypothetical protein